MAEFRMWLWLVPDEITGKRRRTKYRMTEEEARKRFGNNAEKVEWSKEVVTRNRAGGTEDMLRDRRAHPLVQSAIAIHRHLATTPGG